MERSSSARSRDRQAPGKRNPRLRHRHPDNAAEAKPAHAWSKREHPPANAVKVTLGPKGRNVVFERSFWRPHRDQGRRVRGQKSNSGQAENMGARWSGSRFQDL